MKLYREGAKGALLDEYEKAIEELKELIADISDEALSKIVDHDTPDANCKSISTILAHLVRSGYSYAIYVRNLDGDIIERPERVYRTSIAEYINDIDDFFGYTTQTFLAIKDDQLEIFDESKKIMTAWNKLYNIEQIMEHAIVHIVRHRRQIEKFKNNLYGVH